MQYRYQGHISKDGKLDVAFDSSLLDMDVDLIVSVKNKSAKTVGESFIERFSGILEGIDPIQAKDEYLTSKYK